MNLFLCCLLILVINFFNGINAQDEDMTAPGIKCPKGYYHLPTKPLLITTGECDPCARGKYGSTSGLTSSDCTANCPTGRYSDKLAATSIDDCMKCPPGTYGTKQGVTSPSCSGSCPIGKYSRTVGATSSTTCLPCEPEYKGQQCWKE